MKAVKLIKSAAGRKWNIFNEKAFKFLCSFNNFNELIWKWLVFLDFLESYEPHVKEMKELQCLYLHCNSNETWRERELCHLLGIYDVYAPKCVTERCSIWLLFHKSSVLKTENRFFFTPHTLTHTHTGDAAWHI